MTFTTLYENVTPIYMDIMDRYIPNCLVICKDLRSLREDINVIDHDTIREIHVIKTLHLPEGFKIKNIQNITGKVVCPSNCSYMFSHSQFNQSIDHWDVSNVTDMSYMFYLSKFNQPIDRKDLGTNLYSWDMSNVIRITHMFAKSQFNHSIDNWNMSNATDVSELFGYPENDISINDWGVSNVYLQPIGNWDVPTTTDLSINDWDVSNIYFQPLVTINNNYGWHVSNMINACDIYFKNIFNSLKNILTNLDIL